MTGGYREKIKYDDGQRRLLDAIWINEGGISNLADLYPVSPQSYINWRRLGAVPFIHIGPLSEALGITPWAFNYRGLEQLGNATKVPQWDTVVKSCRLPDPVVDYILSGTEP